MSRIHEALKKAEQERALSQPLPRTESAASIVDVAAEASVAIPGMTGISAAAPVMVSPESLLSRSRQLRWNPDPTTMLFFNGEENAPGAEEFRTLRSRLYHLRDKQPLSTLLITSALPKEGKSFTAANLAQVIVRQHGRRALLIDADLRNPQLHKLLGTEPGPGVSEYLRGEMDEGSILQRSSMENLFFAPAGHVGSNAAELLANGRFKSLLHRLGPLFDWIIVDSAPAVPVSDAAILGKDCDGILLIVRSNSTPTDAAKRARNEFAGRNLVGVVLNGITPELSPYMQYYYSVGPKPEDNN